MENAHLFKTARNVRNDVEYLIDDLIKEIEKLEDELRDSQKYVDELLERISELENEK